MDSIPWPVWVIALGVVVAGVQYSRLALARRRASSAAERSSVGLRELSEALRAYTGTHQGRCPTRLAELSGAFEERFVYRRVRQGAFDPRLIVAYDRTPQHMLIDFPVLRRGRGVLLMGGKVLVLSGGRFEKLLVADDALRDRLGLEVPPAVNGGEREKQESESQGCGA